jgi:branched-chain amino acid aminotransferase
MTLPVGPYYSKPVKLLASDTYVRASRGGVGEAKTAGNYAASLYPTQKAIENGYDQILWLDGVEFKYVQEVGTMNIFFCIGDKIITPATTDGTILKGITRDSFLILLREKGYKVEERPLTIDEVVKAHKEDQLKEVFGSGTAAVAINVEKIAYQGFEMNINPKNWAIAKELKEEISGLRNGTLIDKRGWVLPVLEGVNA